MTPLGGRNVGSEFDIFEAKKGFPDSNKHNDVEKNNQVSIAGTIEQVEKARAQLRVSFELVYRNFCYEAEKCFLDSEKVCVLKRKVAKMRF